MMIGVSTVVSAITSVIVTKILAARYFKLVDSYAEDMYNLTKESNKTVLDAINKLEDVVIKIDGEALYRAVQEGQRKADARYGSESIQRR